MNRNLKGTLLIIAIFACGVVVGGVAAKQFFGAGRPPGGGPEGFGPSVMRRLTSELGLSEQQRAAIEPIIKKAGDELRVLRQESMKQSGGVIEAMNAAVTAELTDAQREKFNVLKEAQKARMKSLMEERQRRRSEGGERDRGRDRDRDRAPADSARPPAEGAPVPEGAAPPPPSLS
jgi:Spy/CpxP family protein refolding chaperone